MRMSQYQKDYMAFIEANPGCSAGDVARACKWNPRAGNKWIYDGLWRLRKRGLIVEGEIRAESNRGGAKGLYVVSTPISAE